MGRSGLGSVGGNGSTSDFNRSDSLGRLGSRGLDSGGVCGIGWGLFSDDRSRVRLLGLVRSALAGTFFGSEELTFGVLTFGFLGDLSLDPKNLASRPLTSALVFSVFSYRVSTKYPSMPEISVTDLDSDLLLLLLNLGLLSLGGSSWGSLCLGLGTGSGSLIGGSDLDWLVGGTVYLGSELDISVSSARLGVGRGWLLVDNLRVVSVASRHLDISISGLGNGRDIHRWPWCRELERERKRERLQWSQPRWSLARQ